MKTATATIEEATRRLEDLGFWLDSPFPGRRGPSRLMIAIRDEPTLRHYDPEKVRFWTTDADDRGCAVDLTRRSRMPVATAYSWGKVELFDRFGIQNDFLSLGGRLAARAVAPHETVLLFRSRAPILRLGGHSQEPDPLATDLGAFFGRIMVPIDFRPGVETEISQATPIERYAAFLRYETEWFHRHRVLVREHPRDVAILAAESRQLRNAVPAAWEAGAHLLARLGLEHGEALSAAGAP